MWLSFQARLYRPLMLRQNYVKQVCQLMGKSEPDLFLVVVKKMKLCEVVGRVLPDVQFHFVFPGPFAALGDNAFGKIGIKDRVYCNRERCVLLLAQVTDVLFYFILEYKGRGNFACSLARRTLLLGIDVHFRFHPLTGQLHDLWCVYQLGG